MKTKLIKKTVKGNSGLDVVKYYVTQGGIVVSVTYDYFHARRVFDDLYDEARNDAANLPLSLKDGEELLDEFEH